MSKITNVYERLPVTNEPPKQMVILLHGLGANGQDLFSLTPMLAGALPNAVFVSPDAPFPCDMAPVGFQWFSLQDRDPDKIYKGIQIAAPILDEFISEQLEKHNVSADKCALLGFSQGTMMSLYAGPRYQDSLAGVLGYSGALFWGDKIDEATLNKMPVHLIHGEADQVVPVDAYSHAKQSLEAFQFPVSGHTTPRLGHGIDEQGIESGIEFLTKILA